MPVMTPWMVCRVRLDVRCGAAVPERRLTNTVAVDAMRRVRVRMPAARPLYDRS
jgi:hypothetical protein